MLPESEQATPSPERRYAPRYLLDAGIRIEWGSSILNARVHDISESGMFIVTPDPLWLHAEFSAKLDTVPQLAFDCRVRRVEPGKGMGVECRLAGGSGQDFAKLLASLAGGDQRRND